MQSHAMFEHGVRNNLRAYSTYCVKKIQMALLVLRIQMCSLFD